MTAEHPCYGDYDRDAVTSCPACGKSGRARENEEQQATERVNATLKRR